MQWSMNTGMQCSRSVKDREGCCAVQRCMGSEECVWMVWRSAKEWSEMG